jgi:GNAT superfamily N-acetyltransferase
MVHLAATDADIADCFDVYVQLRPHLKNADDLVTRVRRQMAEGFRLAVIRVNGRVAAVAGFRIFECLHAGKHMYVDDLVTDANQRSTGLGHEMMAWLVDYARQHQCEQLHLDSGVQRFEAHRFYLRERMHITSHHFAMKLKS